MKIVERIMAKKNDKMNHPPVTIGFLGDSVTQGCFGAYISNDGGAATFYDQEHCYHTYVRKILSMLYPEVPFNIVNAGIGGDTAPIGFERMERDLLAYKPDLVVVCFGLNDSCNGMDGLGQYTKALEDIFKKLNAENIETIFMTPNTMCTKISCHLQEEGLKNVADSLCKIQNDGILDAYIEAAKKVAEKSNIAVCDCYAKWKKMIECGASTTDLLANKMNHPSEKMHWLFAYSLVEKMLGI